jgi:plasmid stabilization system protein ParE
VAADSAARAPSGKGKQTVKVLYRPEFWADVEETVVYLAREASESLAVRWQHPVKSGVDKIIENPGRGQFAARSQTGGSAGHFCSAVS